MGRRATPGVDGILLIDKPAGWTSHDVVAKARRITGQPRIGHTGTLDPMATGVLVLCLGKATRLVEYMAGHDKRYDGVVRLGVATDTDDAAGAVIATAPPPVVSGAQLRQLERQFTGTLQQRPPAYSALQQGGERAYDAARKGTPLDIPPREVVVRELRLESAAPAELALRVHCGAGTYVRSLARDIGEALECGAHLSVLRRVAAGGFGIRDCLSLEMLTEIVAVGELVEWLLPADEGIIDEPAVLLSGEHCDAVRNGVRAQLACDDGPARPVARMYGEEGDFLGVGALDADGLLAPRKVFSGA